jgi:hypothetical protein
MELLTNTYNEEQEEFESEAESEFFDTSLLKDVFMIQNTLIIKLKLITRKIIEAAQITTNLVLFVVAPFLSEIVHNTFEDFPNL